MAWLCKECTDGLCGFCGRGGRGHQGGHRGGHQGGRGGGSDRSSSESQLCSSMLGVLGCVGWGWLPLGVVILMTGSLFVTYTIAVINGNVAALFPYISDAGSTFPESAIFAQFLNTAACIAIITLVFRYCVILDVTRESNSLINWLARGGVVCGVLASFGLSLVGNFQADKLPVVHFTGAFMMFSLGMTYCVLDTLVTYKMAPTYNSRVKAYVRLLLSAMGFIAIIVTITSELVSTKLARHSATSDDRKHWEPDDPGYTLHLVAAFGEWTICFTFILYFLSLFGDFRHLDVGLRLHYKHGAHASNNGGGGGHPGGTANGEVMSPLAHPVTAKPNEDEVNMNGNNSTEYARTLTDTL